jgi:membrane associated rhomboid family serine protease
MRGLSTSVRRWYRGLPSATAATLVTLAASYLVLIVVRQISLVAWATAFEWLAVVPTEAMRRPWTLLTMVLVHEDPFHVLFNVLALASLAPWIERTIGRGRFLLLLLACVLTGSVLTVAIGWPTGWTRPVFGATGAVLGLMTAFSLLFPDAELRFWFVAPLKAKNLVWLIVGMEAIFLLGGMKIDVPVHFGGMIAAWAFLRKPWKPAYLRRVALTLRRLRGSR